MKKELKQSMINDFRKYATGHLGMSGMTVDSVMKTQAQYVNPYILEERTLNVTQLDVFSRLMMDRIIFLGTEVNDYTANVLQAQLLYLDSVDSGKDISIYINSPGGSVTAGLGIYDTMQFISSDVATICIRYRNRGKGDNEVQERTLHHHSRPFAYTIRQGVERLRPQLLDDSRGGKGVWND